MTINLTRLSSAQFKNEPVFKSGALNNPVIFAAFGETVGVPSAKTLNDIKAKSKTKNKLLIPVFKEVKFRILVYV